LIEVYTDGSCLGNPGTGGWAFLILREIGDINHFGYQQNTTNNQMELTAAINALEFIKENDEVTLFTDSSYVKNGITSWIVNWKKNNWLTSSKKPVLNKDLWIQLDEYTQCRDITWTWIKAHQSNDNTDAIYNNMADELATGAIKK